MLSFVRDKQERKQARKRNGLLAYLQKRVEAFFGARLQLVDTVCLERVLDAPEGRPKVNEISGSAALTPSAHLGFQGKTRCDPDRRDVCFYSSLLRATFIDRSRLA